MCNTASKYSVISKKPTQPICEEPVFADGGSTAVVKCTADRIVPPSTCEFRLTANSPVLEKDCRQHKAADQDSVIYPGYSRAQCTLRMPVTGNRAGDYQFQVDFTSRDSLKSEPTLTSKISLRATELYNSQDNDHIFQYPDSGDLGIDVHVTGSPAPTRVTLRVRHGESSASVPVSSRYFRWTYERTVGFDVGVIQLSVDVGGEPGSISAYTLEVENGVVSSRKFEYKFTVKPASESSNNTLPVIAGISAGALVFIGLIIVTIVVLLVRRRRAHLRDGSLDYNRPKPGGSSEPGYIYPNFGYAPDAETRASPSPYSTDITSSYLTPASDRPVTQYSLPGKLEGEGVCETAPFFKNIS
ncbi:hypothetical protein ElyMa_003117000 [Elysia marginata]|uniref:CUB domain-containing protein n=1 Tax=Elysia marginata TaxID=1093978 RepID=A0AAV4ITD6_9GAST|nr:hypothetical protein ElyMa_003117000 [Elysia marginata]